MNIKRTDAFIRPLCVNSHDIKNNINAPAQFEFTYYSFFNAYSIYFPVQADFRNVP